MEQNGVAMSKSESESPRSSASEDRAGRGSGKL